MKPEQAAKFIVRADACPDEGGTTTRRMQLEFPDLWDGVWLELTPPYRVWYHGSAKKAGR